ncbi:hypothetical protein Hanom_Chr08g00739791 [Helianthus anomalus]
MLLRCFMAYECWYHSMCILVVCLEAEAAIELDKLLKDASDEYMSTEVSYLGGVSYPTLGGVALIITVIQIIQVPNLKVIVVLSVGVGFR